MSRRARNNQAIYAGVAGAVRRIVDGTVGIFAPETANRMRASRIRAASGSYEGARRGPHSQNDKSGSADAEVLPDLQKLRDNSRAMIRNDAHAASAVRVMEDNVVGKGLRPQSLCTPEDTGLSQEECEAWRRDCEREWATWAERADATGYGSFYEQQRLVTRSLMGDGESIGHAVRSDDGDLLCELIDPDRLESPNFFDTDRIRGGVELGRLGQPIAYHFLVQHPADIAVAGGNMGKTESVPARENDYSIVQHVFRRDRPGQTRGVPWLAAALPYNNHLHNYLNSELIAARVNSSVAMFVKRAPGIDSQDIQPGTLRGDDGAFTQTIRPGQIEYLEEGEEIQSFTPNRPGTQFDTFVTRILRAIWASQGLSYEVVAKDFGNMNYSSARSMLLECRRGFDGVRQMVIRQFCRPWWENVIRSRIASGKLRAPRGFLDNPQAFLAVRWVAPAYGWVDPTKEIEASRMAVEANLSTPYDEAARAGLDAEEIVRDRARFAKFVDEQEKANGLEPGRLSQSAAKPAATPPPATPAPAPADAPDTPDPEDGDPAQPPADDEETTTP